MDSFLKDLIDFIGRRVAAAHKTILNRLDVPDVSGLSGEEAANVLESVERDAVYLQGLADGLELAVLVFQRRDGGV